jgi:hypothetical protein
MTKPCPTCNSTEGVREYLYGMPSAEPDPAKYVIGGCLIDDDMPDYKCIKCATDFYKGNGKSRNRFIMESLEGITITCGKCRAEHEAAEASQHECV